MNQRIRYRGHTPVILASGRSKPSSVVYWAWSQSGLIKRMDEIFLLGLSCDFHPTHCLLLIHSKETSYYVARSSVKRLTPQRNEGGPRAHKALNPVSNHMNELECSFGYVLRWLQSWMTSSSQLGKRLNQRHHKPTHPWPRAAVSVCVSSKLCSNCECVSSKLYSNCVC